MLSSANLNAITVVEDRLSGLKRPEQNGNIMKHIRYTHWYLMNFNDICVPAFLNATRLPTSRVHKWCNHMHPYSILILKPATCYSWNWYFGGGHRPYMDSPMHNEMWDFHICSARPCTVQGQFTYAEDVPLAKAVHSARGSWLWLSQLLGLRSARYNWNTLNQKAGFYKQLLEVVL